MTFLKLRNYNNVILKRKTSSSLTIDDFERRKSCIWNKNNNKEKTLYQDKAKS
jgi:hypothetical protein